MEHLKWIEVDLGAVRHNLAWVRRSLSPGVRLMAVVKADAYGHGAVAISRLAVEAGASHLGVLTVSEALELRRAGIARPIVLLAPPLPRQASWVAREGLEATVDSAALLRALEETARGAGPGALRAPRGLVPVHVDIDFGLGRWGLPRERLKAFLGTLRGFRRLRLAGLSTHLDYVPGKNAVEAEDKLRAFGKLADRVRGPRPGPLLHAANSSILMDFPRWQLDMVRIGNLLYGINPAETAAPLRDPWKFYARIISVKKVRKGEPLGYASEYVAPRRMTVAAVPAGYADGLTMEPAERLIGLGSGRQYWGRLRGQKTPFVGRCGISHALLDVSRVPRPRPGEAVLLPVRRTAAHSRLPRMYLR